jgi:glycosyltransferase involved in cell wall biosynthesis
LLGQPTGIGVFCQGALGALAQRPHLTTQAYAVSWRRRRLVDAHLPPGVSGRQRPMPARPLHALWRRSDHPLIERFVGPVDVVHGTNFVVPPTGRAAAVVSIHDLTPVHHPELCNPATLAYPGLIRRALARGAWVHTDSDFVAGEVVEAFGVEPDRVRTAAPGVPDLPGVGEDEAAAVRRRLVPGGATRYCLAIGTAEPRKDLPGLVRAFSAVALRHPDVALVLAGPEGWGEDELRVALDASPVRARIARTGWVEPLELAALLRGAHVLAFPSRYEGFGFPPLQAMQAGIPVVATAVGSLPEVLGDGALLVEPEDHEGLATALDRCFDDEPLRSRLIAAGASWVARYSWTRCGAELEELYRDARRDV